MQILDQMEIGLMFWAGKDPRETLREAKALGIRCGQLGIPGSLPLEGAAEAWKSALVAEHFTLVTVFAAYQRESYADIPTVRHTVGFIPPATRAEREQRTFEVSDFASRLGVGAIATHIGFIPENAAAPDYSAVLETVRRVADHAARHGQVFALETGQEPAPVLLRFLRDADRPNLRINFDPANMILYGTGDPIEALDTLGPYVVSVHCKDGDWPPKDKPGALGTEKPLGTGAVGVGRFIAKLRQIGYHAPLNIEREIENRAQWATDVRSAVALLKRLRA